MRALAALVALGLTIFASPALGAPTAAFTVYKGGSPGSKPAPLHVHFDATTSTSSVGGDVVYKDLLFEWDYGDPASGATWSTNGLSKNRSIGPVGAHLYRSAGTYTVTLTVTDRLGATDQETHDVVVDDPTVVYASTTACVSTSGNFTGCPMGATTLTSSDFVAAMTARIGAGSRRILFRKGETFNAATCYSTPNSKLEVTVGAYGSGAAPIFQITSANSDCAVRFQGSSVNTATAGGWKFVGIDVRSTTNNPAWGFKTSFIFDDVTIVDSNIGPTGFGFNFGPDQSGLNTPHNHYAMVDTTLGGNTGTPVNNPGSCWFGGARRTFISGVTCGQANAWQMRIAYTDLAVISNNIINFHAGAFEAIKFHCSIGPISANPGAVCNFMVFSDNILAMERLTLASGGDDQGTIEKSLIERNMLPFGVVTVNPNDVFRYNVVEGFVLGHRGNAADSTEPRNNIIEQNTCDGRVNPVSCVSIDPGGKFDNLFMRNNLAFRPEASMVPIPFFANNSGNTATGVTNTGNVSTVINPWTNTNPNRIVRTDYALDPAGSPQRINAGVSGIANNLDLLSNPAPIGLPDLGAVEKQNVVPPPPECTLDSDCNDNDQCTDDVCSSGTCSNTIHTNLACDDGNANTIDDKCSAMGVCAGTPVACVDDVDCDTDGNQCHAPTCVMNACTYPNVADDTTCNDADPMTTNDVCTSGMCAGTVPTCSPACPADDQCNRCVCILGVAISTQLTGMACNDGDSSTTSDICQEQIPSVCMGTGPVDTPVPQTNAVSIPVDVVP